jgi:hypothetical protein
MSQKQSHKLFANVTGCADYSDLGLATVGDGRLCSFFHSAQCVFGFDPIANDICETLVSETFVAGRFGELATPQPDEDRRRRSGVAILARRAPVEAARLAAFVGSET